MTPVFIVFNAGSSSLKFQIFEALDTAETQVVFNERASALEGMGT